MKHLLEQKVYYSDTDAYGVVWHGSYLRWLEMGRTEFGEEIGIILPELVEQNIAMPVVNINLRYKSSAKLNDEIIVETSIQKYSTLSVTFEQKIKDKNSDKTFVEAVIDVVAIDNNGKLYRKMPQVLADAFEKAVKKNEKSFAFTLAEVLIVLGIISIVAVLTIPVLAKNYQQTQVLKQLQKVYSTLAQSVKLSEHDNGSNASWNWGNDAATARQSFDTYWAPYLKITKYCSSNSDCGYNGTFPWKWNNNVNTWTVSPTGEIVAGDAVTSVILSDGTLLVVRDSLWKDLIIDINASKPPNRLGRDVFLFTLDANKGLIGTNTSDCGGVVGGDCARKIIMDSWQIKSDYPW